MLEVHDLTFSFPHRRLFAGLSFTARAGELVHLSGPNGAGKSTCMAIIAGLRSPQGGRIAMRLPDSLSKEEPADPRLHLEYLPAEGNGLYLKMDAVQNLRFWGSLRGITLSPMDAAQALAPWGLGHQLVCQDFEVEKFSTGMKRRLALCRLVLSPCPIWLLDEPLYGLDAQAVATFCTALSAHLRRGGAAVLISHDLVPFDGMVTKTVTLGQERPMAPG